MLPGNVSLGGGCRYVYRVHTIQTHLESLLQVVELLLCLLGLCPGPVGLARTEARLFSQRLLAFAWDTLGSGGIRFPISTVIGTDFEVEEWVGY